MIISKAEVPFKTETLTCSRDILRSIREEKGDRPHEIFGAPKTALWNQSCPLLPQIRILIQDPFCPIQSSA
jgi:hypothetical protein